MPFHSEEEFEYLEQRLKAALEEWDPEKPRRWLARYGGLDALGLGNGITAQRYKTLLSQAIALTKRKRRVGGSDSLPNFDYPLW
jgi:hypothetical protein